MGRLWVPTWLHFGSQNPPNSCLGAVLGVILAVLAALEGLLERLGLVLGRLEGILDRLGGILGHLEGVLEASWSLLEVWSCGNLGTVAGKQRAPIRIL